jgi:hypothetical protein
VSTDQLVDVRHVMIRSLFPFVSKELRSGPNILWLDDAAAMIRFVVVGARGLPTVYHEATCLPALAGSLL